MERGTGTGEDATLRATPGSPAWSRLRWRACRRGMKELDVLLERWLVHEWQSADDATRRTFLRLLDLPDPELASFCLGGAPAPDAALQALVAALTDGRHARVGG